jgi:pimeloyl-ACP methyl ester carboxylesterase
MKLWMSAVAFITLCASPALAQNAGGLPGPEHEIARVAFLNAERIVVHGDVVHYRFDVAVGSGEFDVIRIHRVVKETAPGRPVKKMEGVLLLPGAPQLFEGIFMGVASPSALPEEGSIALFLANNNVDVWGMDYGWTAVPHGYPDLSVMQGWGIEKDAEHTQTALSIARWMRATSGQGAGPIHLLGFSYGGFLVYAVAADDTQRPGNLKNVKGIIPVDGTTFKAANQAGDCNALPGIKAALAAGTMAVDSSGNTVLGRAAIDDPGALSAVKLNALNPYFPAVPQFTFTNYQAALATFVRSRFVGGTYEIVPPPSVDLYFTNGPRFVSLLADSPPYAPYQWIYDSFASRCGSADDPVAFDDHLGEITVPIFCIARQSAGLFTTSLTASDDVSSLIVNSTLNPSLYGHADFFLADSATIPADNAANKIWRPILEWILAHR